jgi:hypothetical protein
MSQERRERRNEKLGISTSKRNWPRIATYAGLVAVALALAFYLNHRAEHKHDAFARCLSQRGAKMYGAWWCPHCLEQKGKFAASFKYVPYVECGIKGQTTGQSQVCKDEKVAHYPTWQFPPTGERVERILTLEEIGDRTGCPLE